MANLAQCDALRRRIWPQLAWWGALVLGATLLAGNAPASIASTAIILGAVLSGSRIWRIPGIPWMIALMIWIALSQTVTCMNGVNLEGKFLVKGISYNWLLVVGIILAGSLSVRKWGIHAWGILAIISIALCLAQLAIGYDSSARPLRIAADGSRWDYASGFLPIRLTLGYVMVLFGVLAAGATWLPARTRWLWLAVAVVGALASTSRAALVAVPAALVVMIPLMVPPRWRIRAFAVGFVGTFALVGIFLLVRPNAIMRPLNGQEGRFVIWRISYDLVKEHPITGVGNDKSFQKHFQAHSDAALADADCHAHNSFLGLASVHGIIAPLLLLAAWASMAWAAWIRRARCPAATAQVFGALAVALSAGQFEYYAGHSIPMMATWLVIGVGLARLGYGSDVRRCALIKPA